MSSSSEASRASRATVDAALRPWTVPDEPTGINNAGDRQRCSYYHTLVTESCAHNQNLVNDYTALSANCVVLQKDLRAAKERISTLEASVKTAENTNGALLQHIPEDARTSALQMVHQSRGFMNTDMTLAELLKNQVQLNTVNDDQRGELARQLSDVRAEKDELRRELEAARDATTRAPSGQDQMEMLQLRVQTLEAENAALHERLSGEASTPPRADATQAQQIQRLTSEIESLQSQLEQARQVPRPAPSGSSGTPGTITIEEHHGVQARLSTTTAALGICNTAFIRLQTAAACNYMNYLRVSSQVEFDEKQLLRQSADAMDHVWRDVCLVQRVTSDAAGDGEESVQAKQRDLVQSIAANPELAPALALWKKYSSRGEELPDRLEAVMQDVAQINVKEIVDSLICTGGAGGAGGAGLGADSCTVM
ncbi:hypothetical protein K491DRAFT_723363 [Lophiostoma macrostomum CBS 122681]|uniref:Uncharacterized protein n=1 Tax=Lophiostoma macrostomum CBS 122681 TaxID=1314788 RepID=A0A6A6SIW5_9PLEO|nr:hypothetical protein K491DRAFT_723363 [Lophiostoma macrostomum CBS 122681]